MSYIHQLPDWPNFRYDAASLIHPLAEVSERRGMLIGRLNGLGFGELQDVKLETLVSEALTSSEIEGERLEYPEVRSSIARRLGMETGGISGARAEGVLTIAIDASEHWQAPLTAERIFDWHANLFPNGKGPYGPIRVGAWRDASSGEMQVVSGPMGRERVHFEAPTWDRLDAEMSRFLQWFEERTESNGILIAGIAHLWFETIHPFEDGNGRIGRAILDLALARFDRRNWRCYSVSEQILEERLAYYSALEQAQNGTMDATAWLAWYLGCLGRALDSAAAKVGEVLSRTQFWRTHSNKDLNERQRAVLKRMLMGWEGKMTNKKWQTIANTTSKTAMRDMMELAHMGIFERDEDLGRNAGYRLIRDIGAVPTKHLRKDRS